MLTIAAIFATAVLLRCSLVLALQTHMERALRTGCGGRLSDILIRRSNWAVAVVHALPMPLPAALAAGAMREGLSIISLLLVYAALSLVGDLVVAGARLAGGDGLTSKSLGRGEKVRAMVGVTIFSCLASGVACLVTAVGVGGNSEGAVALGIATVVGVLIAAVAVPIVFGTTAPAAPVAMEPTPLADECRAIIARFADPPESILVRPRRPSARAPSRTDLHTIITIWWSQELTPQRPALPAEIVHAFEPASVTAFLAVALARRFPPRERVGRHRVAMVGGMLLLVLAFSFLIVASPGSSPLIPVRQILGPAGLASAVVVFAFLAVGTFVWVRNRASGLVTGSATYSLAFESWRASCPSLDRGLEDFAKALFRFDLDARIFDDPHLYRQLVLRNRDLGEFLAAHGRNDFSAFLDAYLEPMIRADAEAAAAAPQPSDAR